MEISSCFASWKLLFRLKQKTCAAISNFRDKVPIPEASSSFWSGTGNLRSSFQLPGREQSILDPFPASLIFFQNFPEIFIFYCTKVLNYKKYF